ncbi:MAG: hypothetical protein IPM83_16440 [Ignavibacteria bacterium]|nr:hypothetical protein [Ignavibacteria bacterium]
MIRSKDPSTSGIEYPAEHRKEGRGSTPTTTISSMAAPNVHCSPPHRGMDLTRRSAAFEKPLKDHHGGFSAKSDRKPVTSDHRLGAKRDLHVPRTHTPRSKLRPQLKAGRPRSWP